MLEHSLVFVLLLFAYGTNRLASSATTASIAATVTVQNVSVSVADGVIAYGILIAGNSKSTITADLNDSQTATNDSNVVVDLNIKGQNTVAWTLSAAAGVDQYVHKYCTTTCGAPPTNFTALTTSYQTLGTGIAVNGTKVFDLQLTTPTTSGSYVAQSVDVMVQAVAP